MTDEHFHVRDIMSIGRNQKGKIADITRLIGTFKIYIVHTCLQKSEFFKIISGTFQMHKIIWYLNWFAPTETEPHDNPVTPSNMCFYRLHRREICTALFHHGQSAHTAKYCWSCVYTPLTAFSQPAGVSIPRLGTLCPANSPSCP